MPFPVIGPIGALLAGMLLGAVLTLFGLVFVAIDRAAVRIGDSVLTGLVSGFRDWTTTRLPVRRSSSPGAVDREPDGTDRDEPTAAVPVVRVRRA